MNNTGLITGASSGIGAELARVHAAKGRDLILAARSEDKLNALKSELEKKYRVTVEIIAIDLAEENTPDKLYEGIKEKGIEIEYLFNNAGFGALGQFHETDWEKEANMIDLNVKALTHLTKRFGKDMVERGHGYIMNVASTASFQPGPKMSVYYASKHYVLAFSEAITEEWREHGVTVSALCPGPTSSNFQKEAGMEGVRLFEKGMVASSRSVAAYGYKALESGKPIAIPGIMNRIGAKTAKFMPRKPLLKLVKSLHKVN